ncbi:hypothetical protein [Cognatiyoonia sp. IB215182]|uniref:hypothetical protein n=1 Tax=Cognatiyoonia sp. IB215182 TaxID=3097353 RepID=UPI002A159E85|nr:hypothetical protein [Cognatiyoonia sp. IB215182]MDX8354630.1 hypothetical protein [Cognatiyoonia sp. IB215182]
MKKIISVVALFGLSACLGGGDSSSDSGVDLTPDTPDVAMNMDFGTQLNGMRMAGTEVDYDATAGRAAQIHANDMFEKDYLSIFLPGTTAPMGGEKDIGDTLNELGLTWQDIGQFIAQGDFTTTTLLDEWATNGSQGDGSAAEDLTFEDFELFGLAKAGSGSDQRWVLVLVNPD